MTRYTIWARKPGETQWLPLPIEASTDRDWYRRYARVLHTFTGLDTQVRRSR